jgi:hypothetical protein
MFQNYVARSCRLAYLHDWLSWKMKCLFWLPFSRRLNNLVDMQMRSVTLWVTPNSAATHSTLHAFADVIIVFNLLLSYSHIVRWFSLYYNLCRGSERVSVVLRSDETALVALMSNIRINMLSKKLVQLTPLRGLTGNTRLSWTLTCSNHIWNWYSEYFYVTFAFILLSYSSFVNMSFL